MCSYCKTEFDFMHCWEFITISKHSLFQMANVKFWSISHFRPTPIYCASYLLNSKDFIILFTLITLNFVAQVVKFIQAIFINLVGSFGLSVSFLSLSDTLPHTENMNSNLSCRFSFHKYNFFEFLHTGKILSICTLNHFMKSWNAKVIPWNTYPSSDTTCRTPKMSTFWTKNQHSLICCSVCFFLVSVLFKMFVVFTGHWYVLWRDRHTSYGKNVQSQWRTGTGLAIYFLSVYLIGWKMALIFVCSFVLIQVRYIFSDKTGTLTRNVMEFKKVSIGGISYRFENTNDLYLVS